MRDRDDPWRGAGADTRAEVRDIFARHEASASATEAGAERFQPLPPFLQLPRRGWRALSPRGRRLLAALVGVALVALAVAWPQVARNIQAGAEQRAQEAAERRAAQRRALIEDQRPRSVPVGAAVVNDVRRLGGLTNPAAAAIVGARMEDGITADVQRRIRAGLLEGPARDTECRPVRDRAAREASYNCFTLSARQDFGESVLPSAHSELSVGYRFSARADLAAGQLFWCKENPQPLHPTSFVVKVPLSTRCR